MSTSICNAKNKERWIYLIREKSFDDKLVHFTPKQVVQFVRNNSSALWIGSKNIEFSGVNPYSISYSEGDLEVNCNGQVVLKP